MKFTGLLSREDGKGPEEEAGLCVGSDNHKHRWERG